MGAWHLCVHIRGTCGRMCDEALYVIDLITFAIVPVFSTYPISTIFLLEYRWIDFYGMVRFVIAAISFVLDIKMNLLAFHYWLRWSL